MPGHSLDRIFKYSQKRRKCTEITLKNHSANACLFSGVVSLWLPASLKDTIKRNGIEILKASKRSLDRDPWRRSKGKAGLGEQILLPGRLLAFFMCLWEKKEKEGRRRVGRKDGHVPCLFCWGFLKTEPRLLSAPHPHLPLGPGTWVAGAGPEAGRAWTRGGGEEMGDTGSLPRSAPCSPSETAAPARSCRCPPLLPARPCPAWCQWRWNSRSCPHQHCTERGAQ